MAILRDPWTIRRFPLELLGQENQRTNRYDAKTEKYKQMKKEVLTTPPAENPFDIKLAKIDIPEYTNDEYENHLKSKGRIPRRMCVCGRANLFCYTQPSTRIGQKTRQITCFVYANALHYDSRSLQTDMRTVANTEPSRSVRAHALSYSTAYSKQIRLLNFFSSYILYSVGHQRSLL